MTEPEHQPKPEGPPPADVSRSFHLSLSPSLRDLGLRRAAGLANTRLDELASGFNSAVTTAGLALGGAFLFVLVPRAVFVKGATPGGSFAVAVFAAVALGAALFAERLGSGAFGPWLGMVAALAAGVSIATTAFAVAIGQPAAWVPAMLLTVVVVVGRLYMRMVATVESKVRGVAGGFVSKKLSIVMGDDRLTPEMSEEIRRIIETGKPSP